MAGIGGDGVEEVSDIAEGNYVTTAVHEASIDVIRAEAATANAAIQATLREWKEMMKPFIDKGDTWLSAPWLVTEF